METGDPTGHSGRILHIRILEQRGGRAPALTHSFVFTQRYLTHFSPLERGEPILALVSTSGHKPKDQPFAGYGIITRTPSLKKSPSADQEALWEVHLAGRFRYFQRSVIQALLPTNAVEGDDLGYQVRQASDAEVLQVLRLTNKGKPIATDVLDALPPESHEVGYSVRRSQVIAYDRRLVQLPHRIFNALVQARILTLEQLAALTDEEILELRNLGLRAIDEIRAFLAHAQQADLREQLASQQTDYQPFLTQLAEAYGCRLDTIALPSGRANLALGALGINEAASLILLSPRVFEQVQAIGAITSQQLAALQLQLAERFGLVAVAGTATLTTVRELQRTLQERVLTQQATEQVEQLPEYGARLRNEFRLGRLAGSVIGPQHIALTDLAELFCGSNQSAMNGTDGSVVLPSTWRALDVALSFASVDDELADLLAPLDERSLFIIRSRYDPYSPLTLEQIGQHYGVTRERVRQIEKKAVRKLTNHIHEHKFLRTRSAIRFSTMLAHEGAGLHDIEADLLDRGLLQQSGTFDDFLVVWQATDLELPFSRELVAAAKEGLTPKQVAIRRQISRPASRLVTNSGAFRLDQLEATEDEASVRAAIQSLGYYELVPGWFRRDSPSRDVVENVARKVFSVTDRVSPREFRRSLMKHLARLGFPAPPTDVLLEVVLRLGFVGMDTGDFVAHERFDPQQELNGSELVLYRTLRAGPPVVTFQELYEATKEAGYATITLAVRLKLSPIIRKVKAGLYTLIGAAYTAEDIAAAEARITEVPAEGELRFNVDGTVTYSVNVNSWLLYGGVLNTGELRQFTGVWRTAEDTTVTIGPLSIWGLKPIVRPLDLQLGARIAVTLNTWDQTISVERIAGDGHDDALQ